MKKILISEVARRYNISRSTLIYYDNIGLLSPYHDEKTKYRYYSLEDIDKLEVILSLRGTGLSLKEIKIFMLDPSHKVGIDLLEKQKSYIKKKIANLQKLESLLERRISTFRKYEGIELYKGIQVNYYNTLSVNVQYIDYSLETPVELAYKKLKDRLDKNVKTYGSILSKYGLGLSRRDLIDGKYERYSYIFDYLEKTKGGLEVLIYPSGYYASILHKGSLKGIGRSLEKLMKYIEKNSYSIIGDCSIVPLLDSWASLKKEDYVYEILIFIDKSYKINNENCEEKIK